LITHLKGKKRKKKKGRGKEKISESAPEVKKKIYQEVETSKNSGGGICLLL